MLIKMEKILAICAILLMILSIFSSVFAVPDDLDINSEILGNSISSNSGNTTEDSSSANTATATPSVADTNTNTGNTNSNTSTQNTTSQTETSNSTSFDNYTGIADTSASTTVSSVVPEDGLNLSNILNILLIVVGVLLILLAIAILIKLKK